MVHWDLSAILANICAFQFVFASNRLFIDFLFLFRKFLHNSSMICEKVIPGIRYNKWKIKKKVI